MLELPFERHHQNIRRAVRPHCTQIILPTRLLLFGKAEEYGSHDKTFEMKAPGSVRIVHRGREVVMLDRFGWARGLQREATPPWGLPELPRRRRLKGAVRSREKPW